MRFPPRRLLTHWPRSGEKDIRAPFYIECFIARRLAPWRAPEPRVMELGCLGPSARSCAISRDFNDDGLSALAVSKGDLVQPQGVLGSAV